jgi:hypothetical protein
MAVKLKLVGKQWGFERGTAEVYALSELIIAAGLNELLNSLNLNRVVKSLDTPWFNIKIKFTIY